MTLTCCTTTFRLCRNFAIILKGEPEVKTEGFLTNMNEPIYEIFHRKQIEQENFPNEWQAEVKEEDLSQIIAVAPNLECDTTDDDSIKLELLHEELDLKTENLSYHQDQMIHEPIDDKPSQASLTNPISTYKHSTPASELPSECNIRHSTFTQNKDLHPRKPILIREKQFKCSICSYASKKKHYLEKHLQTHTGEKPFQCRVCSYACARKDHLESHMKTHTGEKPCKCSVCSYACVQKANLKRHMMTHTGERPFKCDLCSYASVEKHSLEQHMKFHTGEKPFRCTACSYVSAYKRHLKWHMSTHTGEKPFECYTCSFKFALKARLQRHMKTHRRKIE